MDGRESDPEYCNIEYRHRDCTTAPEEVVLCTGAVERLETRLDLDGAPYIVTGVLFVPAGETVPSHWRVLGVAAGGPDGQ
jgi:hypothetical protein